MTALRARTLSRKTKTEGVPRSNERASWGGWIIDATGMLSSDSPMERLLGVRQLRLANLEKKNIRNALPPLEHLSQDRNFLLIADEAARTVQEAGGCPKATYKSWLFSPHKTIVHSEKRPILVVLSGK